MKNINLPQNYLDDMRLLLKDEFDTFIESYEHKSHKGISINTKKISVDDFLNIQEDCSYEVVPWSKNSLYVQDENISKNPLYHTGSYYIQEPSASSVVNFLDVKNGMKVLDMCASPGGKTFQISQKLSDKDLLISNDINNSRMPQLIRNIEYYGLSNVMITNENQENLANNFPNFFDRILLDAPCSGEGMFRKDKKLISSYEKSRTQLIPVQQDLLEKASTMLKVGGKLIYSTCTFNKDENENNIIQFLERHKEFRLIDIPKNYGIISYDFLSESARLFPHKLNGEGHFLCLIEKISENSKSLEYTTKKYFEKNQLPKEYLDFERNFLNIEINGNFIVEKNSIYLEIFDKIPHNKLRIIRNGLYLGDIKNKEFIMSSAFIRYLKYDNCKHKINLSNENIIKYLKGETLLLDDMNDSDYIICTNNLTVGLGRLKNGKLKNLYNKNWRMM